MRRAFPALRFPNQLDGVTGTLMQLLSKHEHLPVRAATRDIQRSAGGCVLFELFLNSPPPRFPQATLAEWAAASVTQHSDSRLPQAMLRDVRASPHSLL